MSGSGDSVEQIYVELAELDARLTELRALGERIDRQELEASDLPLLRALVCECLAEKLAEDGETAGEAIGPICAEGSTSECESKRGPFGVLAWWMAPR